MSEHSDAHWMQYAIEQAWCAFQEDEVPVGAIVVYNEKIIAQAHNMTQQWQDPFAHAEFLALKKAQKIHGKWLKDCSLYVTLEPCPQCAGAIILSRISRVVYGAKDPKGGACGSLYNIVVDRRFNHRPELIYGIMAEESAALLRRFFRSKRLK